MARNQEGDEVAHDLVVIELLARLRIAIKEHRVEKVLARRGVRPPVLHHAATQLRHELDVPPELAHRPRAEEAGPVRQHGLDIGLAEDRDHVPHKGVVPAAVAVEAVEAAVHGAQRDGVERQARVVVRDVDGRGGAVARPRQAQLLGHVGHVGEQRAHAQRAEDGPQDAVRDAPLAAAVRGGEERVRDHLPQRRHARRHELVEARLVAHLVRERARAHADLALAGKGHLEDGAVLLLDLEHGGVGRFEIEVQDVSDQRQGYIHVFSVNTGQGPEVTPHLGLCRLLRFGPGILAIFPLKGHTDDEPLLPPTGHCSSSGASGAEEAELVSFIILTVHINEQWEKGGT